MMPSVCEDIDDIEDLVGAGDLKPSDRYHNKKDVVIRNRKNARVGSKIEHENNSNESVRPLQ
jgi:hypothetical protein